MYSETTILLTGYLAGLFMAYNIGANDASNPTETAVGSGALDLRKAIILFSIFTFLGAVIQGYMVIKTVGKGIVEIRDLSGALAAVLGAGLWILTASYLGLPISTTHSIVGAVLGIGLSYIVHGMMGFEGIKFNVLLTVILSWIISPIISILLAIALYRVFLSIIRYLAWRRGVGVDSLMKAFKYAIIASLAFSAYSFGANDVANATGVYVIITSKYLGLPSKETMFLLAVLGSVGIVFGAATLGKRVIRTVAFRITRLDYVTGAAAEYANALAVWLFTTIPHMIMGFGMPISTTHASVSAVIGVGIAKGGFKTVNKRMVLLILMGWCATVPFAMIASFIIHQILIRFIP